MLFTLGILLASCTENTDSNTGIEIGDHAPAITAQTINGDQFELSQLQGKYVLIDFWASWCGPCLREAPQLVALEKKFNDLNFEIVTIAIEKNERTWKKASDKFGFSWPNQIVQTSQFVRFNDLASAYEVTDIPSSFLLSTEGKILASHASLSEIELILDSELALK